MQVFNRLSDLSPLPAPIALTIGSFDGVHRGHQALLMHLKARGSPVVLTFANHPAEVLRPDAVPPRLCSVAHKLKLFEEAGVQAVILLTFTHALSFQTAEEFLRSVREELPFTALILGPDATMGKDKEGDRARISRLAEELHFTPDYLEELIIDGMKVSSSAIRACVRAGHLAQAEKLLGRPFSLYAPIHTGVGLGKKIGFPTLNMRVEGLCLPPLGVYTVRLKAKERTWKGVANLGIAPTVRVSNLPILEVHLFDYQSDLGDGDFVEVVFGPYLRPEKKFGSLEQLKEQIAADIRNAKKYP